MPAFLEKKLKKEYGENSSIPYKVMNKIGAMHGNKETKKGKALENKKHGMAKKMSVGKKWSLAKIKKTHFLDKDSDPVEYQRAIDSFAKKRSIMGS